MGVGGEVVITPRKDGTVVEIPLEDILTTTKLEPKTDVIVTQVDTDGSTTPLPHTIALFSASDEATVTVAPVTNPTVISASFYKLPVFAARNSSVISFSSHDSSVHSITTTSNIFNSNDNSFTSQFGSRNGSNKENRGRNNTRALLEFKNVGSLYDALDNIIAMNEPLDNKLFILRSLRSTFINLAIICIGALLPVGLYNPEEPLSWVYTLVVLWMGLLGYYHWTTNFRIVFPDADISTFGHVFIGVCYAVAVGLAIGFTSTSIAVRFGLLTMIGGSLGFAFLSVFLLYRLRATDRFMKIRLRQFMYTQMIGGFLMFFGYMAFFWLYSNINNSMAELFLAFLFPLLAYTLKQIVLYSFHYWHFSENAFILIWYFDTAGIVFWGGVLYVRTSSIASILTLLAGQVAVLLIQIVSGTRWYFNYMDKGKDATLTQTQQLSRFLAVKFISFYVSATAQFTGLLVTLLYCSLVRYTYNSPAYPLINIIDKTHFETYLVPGWIMYIVLTLVATAINERLAIKNMQKYHSNLDIPVLCRKWMQRHTPVMPPNALYGAAIPFMFLLAHNGVAFLTFSTNKM